MWTESRVAFCCSFVFLWVVASLTRCNGEIGANFKDRLELNSRITMQGKFWNIYSGGLTTGCFVGESHNLVVEKLPGTDENGGEKLLTRTVGQRLCQYFMRLYLKHNAEQKKWEVFHARRRKSIAFYNIFRRIREYFRKFPAFEIESHTTALYLFNEDRFGNPMPYCQTTFRYVCPSDIESSGLFKELCGSVFENAREVTLLVAPWPTFNMPYSPSSSGIMGYMRGVLSGLHRRSTDVQRDSLSLAQVFGKLLSVGEIKGKVEEFWHKGGDCYFKPLLMTNWSYLGNDICTTLHSSMDDNAARHLLSSFFDTVKFYVRGGDLFSYSMPALYATLAEGMLFDIYTDTFVVLYIDPNPNNKVLMEQSTKAHKAVRLTTGLLKMTKMVMDKRNQK